MADSNQNRRDDFGFADNDPFAELTRIMGHDPRAQDASAQAQPARVEPAAAPAAHDPFESDFDIDLEKELMGEFDYTEFDQQPDQAAYAEPAAPQPAAEPTAHWQAEPYKADDVQVESYTQDDADLDAEALLEAEFETLEFVEAAPSVEDFSLDSEAAPEPHQHLYPEAVVEYEEPEVVAYEPSAAVEVAEEEAGAEAWEADSLDAELQRALYAETAPEPDAAFEPAPFDEPVAAEAWNEPPTSAPAPSWHAETDVGAADASLEDELTALLAGEAIVVVPQSETTSFTSPSSTAYGRANFAPPRPAASFEPAPVEDTYAAAPAEAGYAVEEDDRPASVDASSDSDFDAIFDDGFEFELDASEPVASEPEAAPPSFSSYSPAPSAAIASVYPAAASAPAAFPDLLPEDVAVSQPVMRPAFPAAATIREEMPDVETIELAESAQALTDDLDIPDVDYGEDEPQLYDDLESEITQALGVNALDPTEEEPASWASAAAAPVAAATGAIASQAYASAPAANNGYAAEPTPQAQGQWEAGNILSDDFNYETDLEQAIGMAAYEEPEQVAASKRRRGALIAAALAGVAVIGGAGLYLASSFGGGSDGPAVVLADTEPMKVRPENPGGTTVPNQDSQVYQRVTGGADTAPPAQESLITTAEEPVDITAQGEEAAELLPPGVSTEAGEAPANDVAGLPKSEERIAPEAEPAAAGTPEDLAAVTPRRVRTMVVRPDGTMVPREDLASAAPQQETALAQPMNQLPSLGEVPGLSQPAAEDDGPVVNTPDTVSVVPTRRAEPQTNNAPAPSVQGQQPIAAAPQPQQQPAATPVSAPAAAAPAVAATSEWSMQIASQPTAEGAQTAYQDLARRYGSVLQGRGVNVVRADIQGMGTYYRVRIPAATRDEAIQLCTRYKAAGGSCFVSR